ncbi:MAG: hypothetical protein ACLGPL_11820 [Acidobacteriota bacterium]
MRKIIYRPLTAIGHVEVEPIEGSLADFIQDIPYFLSFDLIPPLSVMNEKFSSGEDDAGMSGGCVWEPFVITRPEYEEVVRELQARGLRYVLPPEWVRNRTDWYIWLFEYEIGVPSEEHYQLWREEEKWAQRLRQARNEDDEETFLECYEKSMKAGQRLAEFVSPFIERYRKEKDKAK